MKKIECIMRPSKLDDVKDALDQAGIKGMTVTNVIGCGLQRGIKESYRGNSYSVNLIPKIKIEVVVIDAVLEKAISIITAKAGTGNLGDGKIFIYDVLDAIRIRTGESGDSALQV
ncbi:P-II family nitrogen regulator [Candidatus Formimonas warabiya]|uniref:Transcriptional regulator n=1 Tax=Formimonas warabiya TaxID=1761012 RepID=A0A3G1L1E3_FORW1|nr:P-II family nitrogen regulator [Candidatus Formimonas warabiya]ATW28468.1 transcriptional regulator [Candidatus Formimonas warabiya]